MTREIVRDIVDICHRLSARGMVCATDGNVSARLENGHILATRSGINKGMVSPQDLVEVDRAGAQISGDGKPSTEMSMHLFVYAERPDVGAVVHAHPPFATGFAAARLSLDRCLLPEVIVGLGSVPLAAYATPSTGEVPESLRPLVHSADAILLANHGVVAFGPTLLDAYFRMEKVEHAAQVTLIARLLGGERPLSTGEVHKLQSISRESYGKDISGIPACIPGDAPAEDTADHELRAYIEEKLKTLGIR